MNRKPDYDPWGYDDKEYHEVLNKMERIIASTVTIIVFAVVIGILVFSVYETFELFTN